MLIPKNIEATESPVYPYFLEEGISSSNDIYIIIPQTTAKIIPSISSLIKGFKHKKAISAPKGSAIPDRNEYLRALYLLLVAK